MSAVFGSVAVGAVAPQALFGTVPANAVPVGYQVFFTDWGANGTLARSNGTRWLPVNGQTMLKHLGAQVTGIVNSATIVTQALIPIGALQANDQIIAYGDGFTKSGATDTGAVNIYCGTAGTTADTALVNSNNVFLSAAARTGDFLLGFKVVSNTSIQRIGANVGGGLYLVSSTTSVPAAVPVSDMSANALWFSVAVLSSSTNDTLGAQEVRIVHVAG